MPKISLLLFISASFFISNIQAADAEFCEQYARDLINHPHAKKDAPATCQKDQPHWRSDKAAHIKWCLNATEEDVNKKHYNHNKLVNLCNDSYKLIMLDRNKIANLPLSADEEMELKAADKEIKQALITGKITTPYTKLYPDISKALNDESLKECNINSLAVDIDKSKESKEWVLSMDKTCIADRESGHIWLVQYINHAYRVLFEGEDDTLDIHYNEHNNYKIITISSRLTDKEETSKRCGNITADWHYEKGRYIPFNGKADEFGDCLPEYNLPDYLQGENTLTMAEDEWEKNMKAEDEKRIALFAPYKQSLEDYIPQWIKNIEQLAPTNEQAPSTVSLVKTVDSSKDQTFPKKGSTNNDTKEEGEKEESKGFIESVRTFFGFE